jgi:hypothetical protein
VLKILPNESIHSYFFRIQSIYYSSDYSNLISTKGGWVICPTFPEHTSHNFKAIDSNLLLKLYRDIGYAKPESNLFRGRFEYLKFLKHIINGYPRSKSHSISEGKIHFCDECIKENIFKTGVGYFLVEWLSSTYCSIHNKSLFYIRKNSTSNTLDAIRSIFKGTVPVDSKMELFKYVQTKKEDSIHKTALDIISKYNNQLTYATPCVEELFVAYSNCGYQSDNNLEIKFKHYWFEESGKFKKIWEQSTEVLEAKLGIIGKQSMVELFVKNKNSPCINCIYLHCPLNSNFDDSYLNISSQQKSPTLKWEREYNRFVW